jgi:hypothetical protein
MSFATPARLTRVWLLLVGVTVISFTNAELLPWHELAVFAIMVIAAAKVFLIMHRFMDVGVAPAGVRVYLGLWTIGCAIGVSGLWLAAR